VFVDEGVLEASAIREGDVAAHLDTEAEKARYEVPEGTWSSLSAELVQSLYRWR
jgi:hypothetical protein